MAMDPSIASRFLALAKARNKFLLARQKDLEEDRKRAMRQQYEAAQASNNGMWGLAAAGAALGSMVGGPGVGTVVGGAIGLGAGALMEGVQNKKTAEQYGIKGYGNMDAFTDVLRPPSMQEAGQMAYVGAGLAAQNMAQQPLQPATQAVKPPTGYEGVVAGANMPGTFRTNMAAPYADVPQLRSNPSLMLPLLAQQAPAPVATPQVNMPSRDFDTPMRLSEPELWQAPRPGAYFPGQLKLNPMTGQYEVVNATPLTIP